MTPYAAVAGAKKGRGRRAGGAGADAELIGEEYEEGAAVESENEDSDNPDADAMIKVHGSTFHCGACRKAGLHLSKGESDITSR